MAKAAKCASVVKFAAVPTGSSNPRNRPEKIKRGRIEKKPNLTQHQQYRKLYSMKATFDFPDDLYRKVKARSAMQGRPIRSVAIDLFQKWLAEQPVPAVKPDGHDVEKMPWLAITRGYVREDQDHEMDAIKAAIASGWGAEVADKLNLSRT